MPHHPKKISEWHRCILWHRNGIYSRNQAVRRQRRQSRELILTVRTVRNAGVFTHVFERRKEPQLSRTDRSPETSHVILSRERLLRIGRWIFDREARIQRRRPLVKRKFAVQFGRAPPRADHHGTCRGAARIRVLLRSPERKLLNRLGRKI